MDASAYEAARRAVIEHPLLSRALTVAETRVFMSHHVFAVWDFMTLLKRLQRDLTCTTLPWQPPANRALARLVNEIVLGEETDDDGEGGHGSHFELYLAAMTEAGADRRPVDRFLSLLESGAEPADALARAGAPAPAAAFVAHTLRLALDPAVPTAAVAAAFFSARESIVPAMFSQLLTALASHGAPSAKLRFYLARHVEVDASDHGPKAERLLRELRTNEAITTAADRAALEALGARRVLWDGVLSSLLDGNVERHRALGSVVDQRDIALRF